MYLGFEWIRLAEMRLACTPCEQLVSFAFFSHSNGTNKQLRKSTGITMCSNNVEKSRQAIFFNYKLSLVIKPFVDSNLIKCVQNS